MPTEAEIIAQLTPEEIAERKAYNEAFMASVRKHDRSENRFKYLVSMAIMDAGINVSWEKRIAHVRGELWTKSWSIFADLFSDDKKWVIECKVKADLSSCAKALGQVIIYRQLVGFKHAILCFPEHELMGREFFGEFDLVCKKNQILLTHENNVIQTIKEL